MICLLTTKELFFDEKNAKKLEKLGFKFRQAETNTERFIPINRDLGSMPEITMPKAEYQNWISKITEKYGAIEIRQTVDCCFIITFLNSEFK